MQRWARLLQATSSASPRCATSTSAASKTGLVSYALRSPCGTLLHPDQRGHEAPESQIDEYLDEYKGPGVQHLAFLTDDILASLRRAARARRSSSSTSTTTTTARCSSACPGCPRTTHEIARAQRARRRRRDGYLLQIFTRNLSARSSSSSSSARTTSRSARATSAPCSARSSATRSAAAPCQGSPHHEHRLLAARIPNNVDLSSTAPAARAGALAAQVPRLVEGYGAGRLPGRRRLPAHGDRAPTPAAGPTSASSHARVPLGHLPLRRRPRPAHRVRRPHRRARVADVPGEHRNALQRHHRHPGRHRARQRRAAARLGATAPSLYDLRNLFQVNVEEGRHLWAMVYLLHGYFGRDGRDEAEALLERRSGDVRQPPHPRRLQPGLPRTG
jgi:predicted Fe-S protein YdhL (DUF1289 family)